MSEADFNTPSSDPYWCKTAPNVPRLWSASSLSTMADCPRRFELAYVEGWSGRGTNLDFSFGEAFHDGMETVWKSFLGGKSKDESLDLAILASWQLPLPPPTRTSQNPKTQRGLAMALTWYFDHYNVEEEAKTFIEINGEPAIELPFSMALPLVNADGDNYIIRGYLDSLRNYLGEHTVWDYKTTGGSISEFYFKRYEIDMQNYVYTAATQGLSSKPFSSFMIDAIGVGISYVSIERQPIGLTPGELDEGMLDVVATIRSAERCAEEEYYPKNGKACTFCDFKDICNKPVDSRINFLEASFTENRRTTGERGSKKCLPSEATDSTSPSSQSTSGTPAPARPGA